MLEVVRRFGSVQFDPLAVAGRNHDLVLHARVADYDPAWCDLLYERRDVFEAFNKGLSLVPMSDVPWFRVPWREGAPRVLAENAEVAERVLERIRSEGPLSALDFERGPNGRPVGMGRLPADERRARRAGGVLRDRGDRSRAARREPPLLRPDRAAPTGRRARAQRAAARAAPAQAALALPRAGLLGIAGSGDVFGSLGPAKPDPEVPDHPGRTALREELVEDGELVRVTVDGVRGPRFVLREELELLAAPPEPPPSVAFLPPLDPLMWDRSLLQPLFDFDWVWEVYTPEPKRRWGYYVLPILFGDRLVGRIEPRIDRADGRVRVLGLWWEDGFAPRRVDGFVDAMRSALRAYLDFAGANRVEWATHLNREKSLFKVSFESRLER